MREKEGGREGFISFLFFCFLIYFLLVFHYYHFERDYYNQMIYFLFYGQKCFQILKRKLKPTEIFNFFDCDRSCLFFRTLTQELLSIPRCTVSRLHLSGIPFLSVKLHYLYCNHSSGFLILPSQKQTPSIHSTSQIHLFCDSHSRHNS